MSKRKHTKRPIQLVLLILLILLMLVSFCMSFIPIGNAQEPEPQITAKSDDRLCAEGDIIVTEVPEGELWQHLLIRHL